MEPFRRMIESLDLVQNEWDVWIKFFVNRPVGWIKLLTQGVVSQSPPARA